jgi:hypothetical protein
MKQSFAGIPFRYRYSDIRADLKLVQAIIKFDGQLDLKFYLPTEKWHLVRYLSADRFGKFTRVWELDDRPDVGLKREPGFWILDALRAGDLRGAAQNRDQEIDKANAAVDASNDREMTGHCEDYAREIRKPLQKLYDAGPLADARGIFPSAEIPKNEAPCT